MLNMKRNNLKNSFIISKHAIYSNKQFSQVSELQLINTIYLFTV